MYSEGREKAKIGVVQIDIKGSSYRIRFTYPKAIRHEFIIARATKEGWTTVIRAAQLINRDIDLGDFDVTYARYSHRHAKAVEIVSAKPDLVQLWEQYKTAKQATSAKTTQISDWKITNRAIGILSTKALNVYEPEQTIKELLGVYAKSTTVRIYADIYSAINLAVAKGILPANPHIRVRDAIARLQKEVKNNTIECFEPIEIRAIVQAFTDDAYCSLKSVYKHSHYAGYVEFSALTGARPEETIALTWGDIKRSHGQIFIKFNKVYRLGVVLPHTKTKEIRLFTCNSQLVALIENTPKRGDLLFPTIEGKYIDVSNFRNRYWKPILDGLVKDGKIEKYLKPYCLRHSFITRLIRSGIDIATVARLAGTSTEMIVNHYLASNKSIVVPEL